MLSNEAVLAAKAAELAGLAVGRGYINPRILPDHTVIALVQLFTTWGLCIDLDDWGHNRRYCYPTFELAEAARNQLQNGDEEPMSGFIAQRPEKS